MTLSELIRNYPFLGELSNKYRPNWEVLPHGIRGMACPGGVTLSPTVAKFSTLPNVYGHELSHLAIRRSPFWRGLLPMLEPTEKLSSPRELGPFDLPGEYPKKQALEEAYIRSLFPIRHSRLWPGLDYRLSEDLSSYITPEQKLIHSYLQNFLKYGYGAGSIEGPRMESPMGYSAPYDIPIRPPRAAYRGGGSW